MREVSTDEPEGLGSVEAASRRVMEVEEYCGRLERVRAVETVVVDKGLVYGFVSNTSGRK